VVGWKRECGRGVGGGDIVCRPVGSNCVVVGVLPKAVHRGV